jgi:hypothetical protein
MLAGYIPIVVAVEPGLGYVASRTGAIPAAGAALAMAAALMLAARIVTTAGRRANLAFGAFMVPFILIAASGQFRSLDVTARSWRLQVQVWNALFRVAPDLAPGTTIMLQLPREVRESDRLRFLAGPADFTRAARLFYGRDDIDAVVAFTDVLLTSAEGVRLATDHPWTPPARALVLTYEPRSQSLLRTHSAQAGSSGPVPLCAECVQPSAGPPPEIRTLVRGSPDAVPVREP